LFREREHRLHRILGVRIFYFVSCAECLFLALPSGGGGGGWVWCVYYIIITYVCTDSATQHTAHAPQVRVQRIQLTAAAAGVCHLCVCLFLFIRHQ